MITFKLNINQQKLNKRVTSVEKFMIFWRTNYIETFCKQAKNKNYGEKFTY